MVCKHPRATMAKNGFHPIPTIDGLSAMPDWSLPVDITLDNTP